jgi:hypothetical protein
MAPSYPEFVYTKEQYRLGKKIAEGTITRSMNPANWGTFRFEKIRYKFDGSTLCHDNFRVVYEHGAGNYQSDININFSVRRKFFCFNEVRFQKNGCDVSFYSRLGGTHPEIKTEWHKVFRLTINGKRCLYGLGIDQRNWTKDRLRGGGYQIKDFANAEIEEQLGFDLFPLILWTELL